MNFQYSWHLLTQNPVAVISIGAGFFIFLLVYLFYRFRSKPPKATTAVAEPIVVSPEDTVVNSPSDSLERLFGIEPQPGGGPGVAMIPASPVAVVPTGKAAYNAMVFTEEGIKFKAIKEKLQSLIYCDPSMPKSGMKYLCVEKADGTHVAYDPRDLLINSKDTAQRAWRATHCLQIVRDMFTVPATNWEKINTILMYVAIGGMIFVAIIGLSKL